MIELKRTVTLVWENAGGQGCSIWDAQRSIPDGQASMGSGGLSLLRQVCGSVRAFHAKGTVGAREPRHSLLFPSFMGRAMVVFAERLTAGSTALSAPAKCDARAACPCCSLDQLLSSVSSLPPPSCCFFLKIQITQNS